MRSNRALLYFGIILFLAGCGTKPIKPSDNHLMGDGAAQGKGVPPTVTNNILPPPKPAAKVETYSVVVTNVSAQEVLFALARDAKINLDIYPGLKGYVTLNAVNQTLPQILDRISKQIDMRYEFDNGNLIVEPDKPYLKTYKIDFINMSRTVNSTINTSNQVGGTSSSSSGSTSGGNTASTKITSATKNDLMESLVQNIREIIVDEDKFNQQEKFELQGSNMVSASGTGSALNSASLAAPNSKTGTTAGGGNQDAQGQGVKTAEAKGTYERAVNVFANKETGVIIVRATSRQHAKVQEFIDKVMSTAKRQVLIEATIAEVTLSSNYQQGIQWSHLFPGAKGIQLTQLGTGTGQTAVNTGSMFVLRNNNPANALSLLETFGTVKVLSSPKLSVMNNQTATLKVVNDNVYFTVTGSVTPGTLTTNAIATFTSTPNTIAVGFVMNVTPEISDTDSVTMNVRPTISRILDYVTDPNPNLANPCMGSISGTCSIAPIKNLVPEIETREMESIIKVNSGQTAVLGGLMQDEINNNTDSVPLIASIPIIGELFKNRNDTKTKTELVIFIRPIVIKSASIEEDYSQFRSSLPDANFLEPGDKKAAAPAKQ